MINKKLPRSGSDCVLAWDLDVYLRQFPPHGWGWGGGGGGWRRGAFHHRWMLKVTSCGRICTASKPEPGSAYDRRHIMTSPGYTGISRWGMQTSAPHAFSLRTMEGMMVWRQLYIILNLAVISHCKGIFMLIIQKHYHLAMWWLVTSAQFILIVSLLRQCRNGLDSSWLIWRSPVYIHICTYFKYKPQCDKIRHQWYHSSKCWTVNMCSIQAYKSCTSTNQRLTYHLVEYT